MRLAPTLIILVGCWALGAAPTPFDFAGAILALGGLVWLNAPHTQHDED